MLVSKVYLCNVPFSDLTNVIDFNDATAQQLFFATCVEYTYTECNYQREHRYFKIPVYKDTIDSCNYIMFQNASNYYKWYYGFITKIEYVNNNCSNVYFVIDPWQTYQFDIQFKPCYVAREHILKSDDKPGFNTLTEPIPCSKLIHNDIQIEDTNYAKVGYIIGCKRDLQDHEMNSTSVYGSMFACGLYYVEGGFDGLVHDLEQVLSGNVLFVQAIPRLGAPGYGPDGKVIDSPGGTTYKWACTKNINIRKPSSLEGYTPDNKKLLCYPYCFLTITANNGVPMEYCYENFYDDDEICSVMIAGECSRTPLLTLIPKDYEGQALNLDKKCLTDTYPSVPFANDNEQAYNMAKSFMATQNGINAVNMVSGVANGIMSIIGSAYTGGGGAAGMTAISQGINIGANAASMQMTQELNQAKLYDNYRANSRTYNNGSVPGILLQMEEYGFRFYRTSITKEYAMIADEYLTKNGYACNRVKQPNLRTRSRFNYVQTIGCNIQGRGVPKPALDEIKQAFDNGITIWHDPNYMYVYDDNN